MQLIRFYLFLSSVGSFGKMRFNNTATKVAITTGDFPKIVMTQFGKVASAAVA